MTADPGQEPAASWTLGELADGERIGERLPGDTADGPVFSHLARSLVDRGVPPETEAATFFVPGRVEVLGKHTDYAGGRSLVAATTRGIRLVATARWGRDVRIDDVGQGKSMQFSARSDDFTGSPGHWTSYPISVVRRLATNFSGGVRGVRIAFVSDLPMAAGLSSSSSLVVATFLAVARFNRLTLRPQYRAEIDSPESLAGYLSSIENGYDFGALEGDQGVGTLGGSEDHVAILCSRAGELAQYRFRPVERERAIGLPPGHVFAVAASGLAAEKTGNAQARYNRLSRLASQVAELWWRNTGREEHHIGAVLRGSADARKALRKVLLRSNEPDASPTALATRLDHFVAESEELVPTAGDALEANDLDTFGAIVDRSQRLAEILLGNQVPETAFLARAARQLGARAASAFGAGFGGAVWALVEEERAFDLLAAWGESYAERFPQHQSDARFFLTGAGAGAREIKPE